ncbi:MAG: biosynthetic-type acetolactate synthase large subunit [Bryobacterales bacterium]|nr:biosynthetic-type acetolactate synthase large subunit [Bryobacterales bacterium]
MSSLMNGARILLDCLVQEGVEVIFGYPGGVTLPLYDALYDHPIRHVLVRHEQNAAFAAQFRVFYRVLSMLCHPAPSHQLRHRPCGRAPRFDSLVAITGQVPNAHWNGCSVRTFGITRSCTKHNYLVKDIEDLPGIIHEAFYLASSGRPGPVLVDIPKDIFLAQAHYQPVKSIHLPGYKLVLDGHAGQIRRAAQMMWEAERPIVYAGGGIIHSGASQELRELVEILDAPAVTTLMGLGALPGSHPNFISMPGMHGSYAANMGMYNTDLIIALGVRFDDRVTGRLKDFAPYAKVIHVDIDPAEIGKIRAADLPIVGDCARVLKKVNKALRELEPEMAEAKSAGRTAWWKQIREWKAEHPLEPVFSDTEIKPQHLIAEMDRLSDGKAIVCSDVGQHQMWAAQLIRYDAPRLWLNSGGLGSMGFGLPSALGAQVACPDKLVFAILGDGGFQMSLPELSTIVAERLPVKIVVMNNGFLGMVRQWQTLFYNNRLSATTMSLFPNAENLGAAFGMPGRTVKNPGDLRAALEEAVAEPGPYLLNVEVSPFENVYPMVPAGGAINEMVLSQPQPVAVPK